MTSESNLTSSANKPSLFAIVLPGMLVAATGVGAGDLATASFSGSHLGVAVLWAVVVGGLMKFVLTEGLMRWQLATGQTLLEGVANRVGPALGWLFLPYLLLWSFFVGSALMSACGATLHAIVPVFNNASDAKLWFGLLCSLAGLTMVSLGGFHLFERLMTISIGIMFATVLLTAALLWPGLSQVAAGLLLPSIPDADGQGIVWTIALIGGVGGTLTILCYGYWIREKGRDHPDAIPLCRIDLGVGYTMTVLFGLAMVIIGSTIEVDGRGADLLVTLADRLEEPLGSVGRALFLVGAFGAVFSSLLGVWQAVPYLFADIWRLLINPSSNIDSAQLTQSTPYRVYQWGIALVPALGLLMSFKEVQKLYATVGAMFIPLLACVLLVMNARLKTHRNRPLTTITLLATVVFFSALAWRKFSG